MSDHVRICIETTDHRLRSLFWFRAHTGNELVWAPYGLKTKQATLSHEWPQQLVSSEPRVEEFRYYFAVAQQRGVPIDHLTSHVDGTFHIKPKDSEAGYLHRLRRIEQLGERTGVFVECNAMSDVGVEYQPAKQQRGAVVLPVELGAGVRLHFAISGRRFALRDNFQHQPKQGQISRYFEFGNFAAIVLAWPYWPDIQLAENRFPGTFLTFRFGLTTGGDYLKTFVFC